MKWFYQHSTMHFCLFGFLPLLNGLPTDSTYLYLSLSVSPFSSYYLIHWFHTDKSPLQALNHLLIPHSSYKISLSIFSPQYTNQANNTFDSQNLQLSFKKNLSPLLMQFMPSFNSCCSVPFLFHKKGMLCSLLMVCFLHMSSLMFGTE